MPKNAAQVESGAQVVQAEIYRSIWAEKVKMSTGNKTQGVGKFGLN